jgi:hypothetical protein
MPFVFPSATLSKGSRRLQPAVKAKIAADVNTGKFGDTANKNPADTGATTPVLIISLAQSWPWCRLTIWRELRMFRKPFP